MKVLVLGGSGATGRLLVSELLERGMEVRTILRHGSSLPDRLNGHGSLEIIRGNILEMSDARVKELISDCDAMASCLGHNMSLKGLFGKPQKLVRDSIARLVHAAHMDGAAEKARKLVLMNTAGNRNAAAGERYTLAEHLLTLLIRALLPPHRDNEQAAALLQGEPGRSGARLEWVVVRPDNLIDEERFSAYTVESSPVTSPLLKPGKTSRLAVARFMTDLLRDPGLWDTWQGQMPVLYGA